MKAVHVSRFGGPEVLEVVDLDVPRPGPGQVLVDVDAAGVNFADTHATDDSYLRRQHLPFVPGTEVVGVARGGRYDGRRVVALLGGGGGYAEQAVAPEALAFPVPDEISDGAALALVLQGTTAWHLLRTSTRMGSGESVVVHAGSGGVGSIAVQLARQWGAGRVIATASSPAKRELAVSLGAHAAVDVSHTSTADEVRDVLRDANEGRSVDVVLEMTGGHVFDGSLAALAPLGRLAVYGLASRVPPTPISPVALMGTSRTVAGFWLVHAVQSPNGLQPAMDELLSLVRAGRLRPVEGGTYPLEAARQAHAALLARDTTGKLVLRVGADPTT
ncbi:MAG TPA: zinc-binding dehydrogenase [Kineosporiaceae bacterium]|nr:zinc-binding dehydrogenase [Kineosporiaceae bacterium]